MEKNIKDGWVILMGIITSPKAKTFYWGMLNSFISILIVGFSEIEWVWAAPTVVILNMITKYINKNYLQK